MSKRRTFAIFCVMALVVIAIGYGRALMQGHPPMRAQNQRSLIRQQDVYEAMFRHRGFIKKKAQEIDQGGNDGRELREFYKRHANLSDQEDVLLDQVASDCNRKLDELRARAKQIIDEARAKTSGGRLNDGETPPPPPAELEALQREREATVLQALERLHQGLGQAAFNRLDEFTQRQIVNNMKDVMPLNHQPASPARPHP
jgi:hypothetical protein